MFVSWFVNSFDSDVHATSETSFESTCQRDALSPSYVSEWPDGSITKKDCLSCHVPAKADDWILREGLANPSVQIVADEQNRPKILFLTRLDCPAALFSPLEAAV